MSQSQIHTQKCPACGAPLRFDPASGKMVCDYCGTTTDLGAEATTPMQKPGKGAKKDGRASAEETESVEDFDFASLSDAATVPDAASLPVYNCVSCGAEVIAPAEQMALTCPYCGNNIVLTDKVSGKLRPNAVIPFKIQARDLPDAVNRFYKGKKLLPRRFFSESTMGKVTGVYVPFWVFKGRMSGMAYFDAQTSSSSRHGDYIITETRHYKLAREAAMDFQDIPVDASEKVDNRLMDSLEPFHMEEARDFDMRYLAGFTADRFDQKKDDIASRAKQRMVSSAQAAVTARAQGDYGAVTPTGNKFHARLDAKYILFPVYMFHIEHAGKTYPFAVNGQTGKVVGDLPNDSNVSFFYFLKRFGLVAGGLAILSFAKYMMGM